MGEEREDPLLLVCGSVGGSVELAVTPSPGALMPRVASADKGIPCGWFRRQGWIRSRARLSG